MFLSEQHQKAVTNQQALVVQKEALKEQKSLIIKGTVYDEATKKIIIPNLCKPCVFHAKECSGMSGACEFFTDSKVSEKAQ